MMAFTTRCCTKRTGAEQAPHPWLLAAALRLCALALALMGSLARVHAAELSVLRVERLEEGLFLSARVDFALAPAVEAALHSGIPVHFVASAEVLRQRWYWYDQTAAQAHRYMRVSYQPLTRRWRLNTSSEPLADTGLGTGLTQSYDSLPEVLAAVQRIGRWKIAEPSQLQASGRHVLQFRFRLDASQLPRALQLGLLGQPDWLLSVERRIDLTQELNR